MKRKEPSPRRANPRVTRIRNSDFAILQRIALEEDRSIVSVVSMAVAALVAAREAPATSKRTSSSTPSGGSR